jgi:hypothetical protein
MRVLRIVLACLMFAGVCAGIREHQLVKYDGPAKRLQGKVTDITRSPIPWVNVEVYDHPEVWNDDSLSWSAKRARQKKIASAQTGLKGLFSVGGVSKGVYEVQFSRMGWNILSVVMRVDPESRGEGLCVELQVSGGGGSEGKVTRCR